MKMVPDYDGVETVTSVIEACGTLSDCGLNAQHTSVK